MIYGVIANLLDPASTITDMLAMKSVNAADGFGRAYWCKRIVVKTSAPLSLARMD